MTASVIVYEDQRWQRFLPLVYLRGVFELRCGSSLLWQRIERLLLDRDQSAVVEVWCRDNLQALVAEQTERDVNQPVAGKTLLLNGRGFWLQLPECRENESAWVGTVGHEGEIACLYVDDALTASLSPEIMQDSDRLSAAIENLPRRDVSPLVTLFDWPWELVHFNGAAIRADWTQAGLDHAPLPGTPPGSHLLNPAGIHIGAGTRIKPCVVIDAEDGPVWIGANVTIQPHAYIQGPCYIGNDCLIHTGANIREGCSFGRRCKVGGEVEASIIQSFSNKQHGGFLGHSYLGEWINLGANSVNSDLKNTYGTIRVPLNGSPVETGRQIVGMLMGDFSKTGINVAFPTGAVVGVCANIVATSPPKFTRSFTWLEADHEQTFDVERGLTTARRMMARRLRELTAAHETAFRQSQQVADCYEAGPSA